MAEFFQMGGYAAYVWPSYGLTALVLVVNAVYPAHRRRRLLRDIAQAARREEARTRA